MRDYYTGILCVCEARRNGVGHYDSQYRAISFRMEQTKNYLPTAGLHRQSVAYLC